MNPVLEVETVGEAIFERVVTGQSGFVVLPRTAEWSVMTVRSWPWWLQRLLLGLAKDIMRPAEEAEEVKDREAEKARLLAEKGTEGEVSSFETGPEGKEA